VAGLHYVVDGADGGQHPHLLLSLVRASHNAPSARFSAHRSAAVRDARAGERSVTPCPSTIACQ
jgi:hypothetical protein